MGSLRGDSPADMAAPAGAAPLFAPAKWLDNLCLQKGDAGHDQVPA